jgi:hypothetical protein
MKDQTKPPPVLLGERVVAYALNERGVEFSGHTNLFVDGREIGRVPRLVLCRKKSSEVLLLHCNRAWSVKGIAAYPSLRYARKRAERIYPGVSNRWVQMNVTSPQAERYLRKMWAGKECSFCGRRPDQVRGMVSRMKVRICDRCATECHEILRDAAAGERGA